MGYLTESLKIEILMMIGFGDRSRTQAEVAALFHERHPDLPAISQSTISKIENRYREVGHVRDIPRVRQSRVMDEDTQLNVLLTLQENPNTPVRQVARECNISHTSALKLVKSCQMRPYKMQYVQELLEDDPDRRLQFCEVMMNALDQHLADLDWILFTDECTFALNGEVNKQNCRYWSTENPHWMRETHTQRPQKVNVWAGIIGDQVIGPIYLPANLNGTIYLNFLQEEVMPALTALFPHQAEADLHDDRIWFQQDGAPPHYAQNVRHYLSEVFPNRWIGRRGTIEWAPRSPDLNPLDYFLWGHLKTKVYVTRPENLDELMQRLTYEIRQITPDMIRNVKNEFYFRLGFCQEKNGQHFQQYLP